MAELMETAAPVENAAPVETPVVNAGGGESWITGVPEQYRESNFVKKYDNQEAFFNGMDNLSKIAGTKVIPDFETAPADEIARFKEKVGAPVDVSAYDIKTPEGFEGNEQFDAFKAAAFKAHVPNDVANEFHAMHIEGIQSAVQEFSKQQEDASVEAMETFKSDVRFGEISSNAQNLLDKVDPDGSIFSQDEINNLGTAKPAFMKLLDKMVSLTGDASVVKSTTGDVGLGPEDQVAKIREDFRAKRISQETANARINTVWAQSKN